MTSPSRSEEDWHVAYEAFLDDELVPELKAAAERSGGRYRFRREHGRVELATPDRTYRLVFEPLGARVEVSFINLSREGESPYDYNRVHGIETLWQGDLARLLLNVWIVNY